MNRHRIDLGALIEANRTATAPSAEDRERNRRRLASRIGAGVLVGSSLLGAGRAAAGISTANVSGASAGISGAVAGGLAKWIAVSALVAVGGGIGLRAIRRPEGPGAKIALPAAVPTAISAPPVTAAGQGAVADVTADRKPKPASHTPSARASASVADKSFARALELLRSAQRALDKGSPSSALSLLDEYAIEFPRGCALQPEYEATRVLALCGAGRTEAAERARNRFLENQSASPLADRVRAACGAR